MPQTSQFGTKTRSSGRLESAGVRPRLDWEVRNAGGLPLLALAAYLCGRLSPSPAPGSDSGTAEPAPDSADLAARKRRVDDPVPDLPGVGHSVALVTRIPRGGAGSR